MAAFQAYKHANGRTYHELYPPPRRRREPIPTIIVTGWLIVLLAFPIRETFAPMDWMAALNASRISGKGSKSIDLSSLVLKRIVRHSGRPDTGTPPPPALLFEPRLRL